MRSIPFVLAAFAFSAPALAQSWDECSYPEYAISVAASAVSGCRLRYLAGAPRVEPFAHSLRPAGQFGIGPLRQ